MLPPTSASCARAAGIWLRAPVPRTPDMVTTASASRARFTCTPVGTSARKHRSRGARGVQMNVDDFRQIPCITAGQDPRDRNVIPLGEFEDPPVPLEQIGV